MPCDRVIGAAIETDQLDFASRYSSTSTSQYFTAASSASSIPHEDLGALGGLAVDF